MSEASVVAGSLGAGGAGVVVAPVARSVAAECVVVGGVVATIVATVGGDVSVESSGEQATVGPRARAAERAAATVATARM